jgi:hypothetical protein
LKGGGIMITVVFRHVEMADFIEFGKFNVSEIDSLIDLAQKFGAYFDEHEGCPSGTFKYNSSQFYADRKCLEVIFELETVE